MHPKVHHLRRLMDGGFTLSGIRSDASNIHARLTEPGGTRIIVRFDRSDAHRLLYDDGAFGHRGRGGDRWRVRAPLR